MTQRPVEREPAVRLRQAQARSLFFLRAFDGLPELLFKVCFELGFDTKVKRQSTTNDRNDSGVAESEAACRSSAV